MYPRNAASPEPIAIGVVLLTADGTIQTSGVTVRIKPIGVSEADGAGTIAYSTDGIVLYTPTQAETNYTSFILIASKTGCIPTSITIITTASATPGTVAITPPVMEQIRHRLGIDGTATAPSTATGAKLGDLQVTQIVSDSSAATGKIPLRLISNEADSFEFIDNTFVNDMRFSPEDGSLAMTALAANISGDIGGKVLGAGSGTITGTGVRAELASGEIEGIVTELLAKDVIAIATVLSGSSASVLVSTSSSELLIPHYLRNCLMVITDITNGNEQVRWIASHIEDLDTGYMTITPDEPFGFTPAADDTIKIYRTARWTGVKAEDVATIKSNTDNALRTGVSYTHTNDDTSESVSVTITPSP